MGNKHWPFVRPPVVLGNRRWAQSFEYAVEDWDKLGKNRQGQIKRAIEGDGSANAQEFLREDLAAFKNDNHHHLFASLRVRRNREIPLGKANRFDRFIWDLSVRTGMKRFQILTLFTNQLQANYFFVWENNANTLSQFYCTFFELKDVTIDEKDWHFIKAVNAFPKHYKRTDFPLSELIYWNQYIVKEGSRAAKISFNRRFLVIRHTCRRLFNNLPLITEGLNRETLLPMTGSLSPNVLPAECRKSALGFYDALAAQKSWVPGVGAPMRQTLDQLGSAMSNHKANITLVSGLPGTGKDNYMKALHFAGTACDDNIKKRLVITTALEMETSGVAKKFKEQCENCMAFKKRGGSITFVIDELNKAREDTRSALLRVLANPKEFLNMHHEIDVRFIMAASDHLDRLAQHPPQDFWTRIKNQMRVSHPLGRVSEQDAEDFLEAFFWFTWWGLAKDWLDNAYGDAKNNPAGSDGNAKNEIAGQILGHDLFCPDANNTSKKERYGLSELVCKEFVQTLTPIAVRDEISIRGLDSMMRQVFFNVMWSTRYGLVPVRHNDDSFEEIARRGVNHAIQDVLAILNASRSTPRTASDSSPETNPSKKPN